MSNPRPHRCPPCRSRRASLLLDLGDPRPGLLARVRLQGPLGRSSARFRPTWVSCSASACRQPASTSAGSASARANLSLLVGDRPLGHGNHLVQAQAVSWVRTPPFQERCSCARSSSRASRRRASGGEVSVSSATSSQRASSSQGWLRSVRISRASRGGSGRRALGQLVAAHGERCRIGAAGQPARAGPRLVARSATRQSSWVLSRRLPAKRASRRPSAARHLARQLAVLLPQRLPQLALVLAAHAGIADAGDQGLEPGFQGGPLLGRDAPAARAAPRAPSARRTAARSCARGSSWKARGAVLADEVVGIEALGQEGELHAVAGLAGAAARSPPPGRRRAGPRHRRRSTGSARGPCATAA